MLVIESGFVLNGVVCAPVVRNPGKFPEMAAVAEGEMEEGKQLLKLPSNTTAVTSGAQSCVEENRLDSNASTKGTKVVKADGRDTHSLETDLKYAVIPNKITSEREFLIRIRNVGYKKAHVKSHLLIETENREASAVLAINCQLI
jgi:hypothetical protein